MPCVYRLNRRTSVIQKVQLQNEQINLSKWRDILCNVHDAVLSYKKDFSIALHCFIALYEKVLC